MNAVQRTQQLISRKSGIPESNLTPGCTLESLGIDSLSALELLIDIEDEIGRRLPPGPQRLTTVGEIFALVEGETR
jgi:acyl carrier protein